ncbi:MAG: hypothetical protein ACOZNI_31730 [Myxococcota bacterium]
MWLVSPALAATWSVAAGDSIQEAIDAALDGDRVEIAAGAFQEGLDLAGKSLTLVGAGSTATTVGATSVATCLVTGGGDLVVEGLSFAACEVGIVASGGTLDFRDVEIWGAVEGGTADGVTWVWDGGALSYLDDAGLVVTSATLDWTALVIEGNETGDTLVVLADTTATIAGLVAADNDGAVLALNGGALTLTDGAVSETTGATASVYVTDGALVTARNTFGRSSTLGLLVSSGTWSSTDDTFEGGRGYSGAAADSGVEATLSGATFTGFSDVFASITRGTIADLASDGGELVFYGVAVTGCAMTGGASMSLSGATVTGCSFEGAGGAAIEGAVTLLDSTVDGYAYAFAGGDVLAERCVFSDVGGLYVGSDAAVVISDSTVAADGPAVEGSGLDVALTGVEMSSSGVGLAYSGAAVLADVTLTSHSYAVLLEGGTLDVATSAIAVDRDTPAIRVAGDRGRAATIALADTTIDGDGDGVYGTGDLSTTLTTDGVDLVVAGDGIVLENGETTTLRDTRIDAGGVGVDVTGSVVAEALDVVAGGVGVTSTSSVTWDGGSLRSGEDALSAPNVDVADLDVEAGGDGIVANGLVAERVSIEPAGACISAGNNTLTSVRCSGGAGERPVDVGYRAVWTDVVVEDFASASPSKIADATGSLSRVRFFRNSTEDGPGALTISRSTITAEGLFFRGNTGVDAGALWATESTLTVNGAVFRENVASEGPDAVLEAAGGDWACVASDGAFEVAEEATTLRNVTLVDGLVLTGAFAEVDSAILVSDGAAVSGEAGSRTALFVYNDVWGSPAFADGLTDYTGQNGNISADPLLDDELRLLDGSPCLDAGNPAYPDPDGSPPDMGARAATCPELDFDGDGQLPSEGDCDDDSEATYAGAEEVPCDGLDNDCAGDGDDPDCGGDTGDSGGADDTGSPDADDTGGADTDGADEEKPGDRGSRCACGGGSALVLVPLAWARRRRLQTR